MKNVWAKADYQRVLEFFKQYLNDIVYKESKRIKEYFEDETFFDILNNNTTYENGCYCLKDIVKSFRSIEVDRIEIMDMFVDIFDFTKIDDIAFKRIKNEWIILEEPFSKEKLEENGNYDLGNCLKWEYWVTPGTRDLMNVIKSLF
ncbi:MAG: hypothetical protein N4A40_12540 [Tissierellales bacterium]|jgi:hypothetical protein|nr:hypothetical protein [Tissierellales bacterium]